MRKLALVLALLAAWPLLLAGCGAASSGGSGQEVTPPATAAPAAEADAENTGTETEAREYTYDTAITENGRGLTLRLHGQADTADGSERIGISSIDVLEGDSLLQTLSIGDAFDQLYREQGFEDWVGQYQRTDRWTEGGSLSTDDLNFDGCPDLRLLASVGVVNISYLCWLWDPETEQFTYAFELLGYDVQVDTDTQQIIAKTRDGWGQYYTNYYRYDGETGTLLQLKEVHEDYTAQDAAEDQPAITVHELIDGEWIQTE